MYIYMYMYSDEICSVKTQQNQYPTNEQKQLIIYHTAFPQISVNMVLVVLNA